MSQRDATDIRLITQLSSREWARVPDLLHFYDESEVEVNAEELKTMVTTSLCVSALLYAVYIVSLYL